MCIASQPLFFTLVLAEWVVANNLHPCVNKDLLTEILKLKRQDFEWKDILSRLRPQTVPSGYTYHPRKTGMILKVNPYYDYSYIAGTNVDEETEIDMLRSILAQLEFRYTVRQCEECGVPFRTYLKCTRDSSKEWNDIFGEGR